MAQIGKVWRDKSICEQTNEFGPNGIQSQEYSIISTNPIKTRCRDRKKDQSRGKGFLLAKRALTALKVGQL